MSDTSEERWIDLTVLGSPYERQFDPQTGRYRHRVRALSSARVLMGEWLLSPEWVPGDAPDFLGEAIA